jgi:hypothetical protein
MKTRYFYGYMCRFSNFYFADMEVDGEKYPHMEQYYQSQKAWSAGDHEKAAKIKGTGDPRKCKSLGKNIKCDWDKEAVMLKGLRAKFSQNPELKKALMDHAGYYIAEDSPYDTYWGTGPRKGHVWAGKNRLGMLLMQVRDELLMEEEKTKTASSPDWLYNMDPRANGNWQRTFTNTLVKLDYELEKRHFLPEDYLWVRKTTETAMDMSWVESDRMKLMAAVRAAKSKGDQTPGVALRTIGGRPDREWYFELFDHENTRLSRVRLCVGDKIVHKKSEFYKHHND